MSWITPNAPSATPISALSLFFTHSPNVFQKCLSRILLVHFQPSSLHSVISSCEFTWIPCTQNKERKKHWDGLTSPDFISERTGLRRGTEPRSTHAVSSGEMSVPLHSQATQGLYEIDQLPLEPNYWTFRWEFNSVFKLCFPHLERWSTDRPWSLHLCTIPTSALMDLPRGRGL